MVKLYDLMKFEDDVVSAWLHVSGFCMIEKDIIMTGSNMDEMGVG